MPRPRWIDWDGRRWRLTELARAHGLNRQTLAWRLDTGQPLAQALSAPPLANHEAIRRAYRASHWHD
jgi:hypothetical protein